jgi:hypothetical protein
MLREYNILSILCCLLIRLFPDKEEFELVEYTSIEKILGELIGQNDFINLMV